ncbi:RE1 [Symbiodinium sp. CCMP2592]|nr:RE1 [Symbiodinium sp. CCMP2592]
MPIETEVQPERANNGDPFHDLPAGYQQVMSPSGRAAQVVDPNHDDVRPNGVARRTPADDAAYSQALAATGTGAPNAQSAATVDGSGATALGPTGTAGQGLDGASSGHVQNDDGAQSGRRMSRIGHEVFSSPVVSRSTGQDPALFPHSQPAASHTVVRAVNPELLLPSPMPSPTAQAVATTDTSLGYNLAQQGAAAMRWVTKLSEFVQRRASYVTQGRAEEQEQTTVVHETMWSPTSRAAMSGEDQPLFSRSQARRLHDMAAAAPQLYGSVLHRSGGSESSASYTKDQLEAEVRRQVEQAMEKQRGVSDENRALKAELEKLRRASKAIQQDFPDMIVSKGVVSLGYVHVTKYQEETLKDSKAVSQRGQMVILGDFEDMMVPEGVKVAWSIMEGVGAIHQDFRDMSSVIDLMGRYGNSEGGVIEGPPGLLRGSHPHQGPGGDESSGDRNRKVMFGGNPAGLSGHDREQGGISNEYASGISGGPFVQYASGISGEGGRPSMSSGAEGGAPKPGVNEQTQSPMEALAHGIAQLQTAMAMQMGMSASRPEAIRPGTSASELPKLVEADEMAAINVGDWLHGLSGPMGDLTDGSAQWWSQVLSSLDAYYDDYINASAVKKLQMKAEDYAAPMLKESKWLRVDKRAASMLLQAIPDAIRMEVLANRLQTTLAILARILTIYRPGSAVERQQVLKALESPGNAANPMELVECLRKWARWLKRAQDLGLQVPDPSILLKGLDQSAKAQLERHSEVMFRTNMLRSVVKYHSHLLGEFEQIAYRGRARTTPSSTAALKAVGVGASEAPNAGQVARDPIAGLHMTGQRYLEKNDRLEAESNLDVRTAKEHNRGQETGGGPRDVDEFLRNATQILKLMTEQQSAARPSPSMKMLKKAIMEYESKMALVDSGATHPLRRASNAEWDSAPEVEVVVAGEDVKKMGQNRAGTLLLDPATERSQTILPVGSLVGVLGYEMIWSKRRCFLRSPEGKELPMKITTGCPEVAETTALELTAKIEEEKLLELERNAEYTRTAMMRAQGLQRDPVWEKSMKAYVAEGKFEDGFRALSSSPWAHDHLNLELARVVSDLPKSDSGAWNLMQQLGFNRRMRKRMMTKDWIVKLCSGRKSPTDKLFKVVESNGTMVLDKDRQRLSQLDILKSGPSVMMMLLWGAATGRIAGIVAGLPKHSAEEHVLRAVSLYEVAKAGRAAMCEAMDVPLDGVAFALWASAEAEEDEVTWIYFTLGKVALDIPYVDPLLWLPTWMLWSYEEYKINGYMMKTPRGRGRHGRRCVFSGVSPGPEEMEDEAWLAVDRKAWERHLMNDHLPYRADCLQCIHNATGRPHRRCLHRDCYVMSADTLGPVRVPGPKGERYAVVFTYQFPKQHLVPEDQPLPEEELDGWNLDAKPKGDPELPTEGELDELQREHQQPPEEDSEEIDVMPMVEKLTAKATESGEDWWEFREAAGVLIRHHVAPRTKLFRPTSWNACPLHPATLDYTRVTEVKYVGGGVETETSDWHRVQSGARALDREWTGRTTFRVSAAEIPEEEEEMQKDEAAWEKLVGDLTKPVDMDTIYMVYPVRSRRGGDIMLAVQEAVLRLKLLGMPVARLHSDRGSEFASKGLRKWLLDRDIYHTRSEALVPQTNGAAERGVRWFKTMAKVLMAEAKVSSKFWTLAMQHAANRRMYERLGLEKPRLLKFGSKVMIRRKVFGNNKKYDLTDRWEEGTYLGLSDTIKGGAVVLRPSGVITETLNLKLDVVDPHLLLAEPEEDDGAGIGHMDAREVPVVDLPDPARRLREKTAPPALRVLSLREHHELQQTRGPSGWTMRSIVKQQEDRAKHFYDMGKFDLESCAEVLSGVHLERAKRQGRGEASSLVLGAYVHGGLRGATISSRRRPWLTKYLNMALRQRTVETTDCEPSWTTLGVFRAADIPPHRDLRNQPGSRNFVMEVGIKSAGGLWMSGKEDYDASFEKPHQRELPDGSVVDGVVMDITKRVAVFDPKKTHSYINPEDGDRWIVAGFTPLGVEMLPPEPVSFLNKCGFPLDQTGLEIHTIEPDMVTMEDGSYSDMDHDTGEEEDIEKRARVLRCVLQEERKELEEPEVMNGFQDKVENALWECERELHWFAVRDMRKIMKVSPGEAQDIEVEKLLGSLGGSLEVVYNVSLPEVKKYLDRWKPAILKEVQALIDSGTVRRLSPEQTRELKKDGLVVLPGKAVFTAKPPVDASLGGDKYRRKCRIVVCGNYLPDRNLNVYASGTSPDSLRIAIAYAVKMAWLIGSTDVANAFTLAPMPGGRLYAVSPPTVVVMAQGAAPGETWLIERVLYGLREAPRLWGCFRNERLAGARIETEEGVLVLRSMTTDENMWKICFETDETMTPQGLLLVYVDDILFLSTKEIVLKVYQWLIQDWKCSALEWMHEGFIRFLGIELRSCEGGVHLSQAGYVRDLLRQHGVSEQPEAGLTIPCQREWLQDDSEEEPETVPEESVVKLAQKATGEALWLSTRSRPELTHAVACMASYALRKPFKTLEISKRILKYLSRTVEYGIWYKVEPQDPLLVVYSDASYAPGGGRSFGSTMAQVAGMPVAWRSAKQPVITLSVAEAELYEGISAVQLGLGISAILSELEPCTVMHLRIDNAAAQGLASEAPGCWKTRHLRIRARYLRQEVAAQRLVISHVNGSEQKADLGTKGFDLPKFKALMNLWNIIPCTAEGVANAAVKTLKIASGKGVLVFVMVCLLLIKGVQGAKDDLQLDGSMEFYAIVILCGLACVVVWEVIKKAMNGLSAGWKAWTRKQRKVERLRERAEAAVRDEFRRREKEEPRTPRTRTAVDIYGTPGRGPEQTASSSSGRAPTRTTMTAWDRHLDTMPGASSSRASTRTVSTQTEVLHGFIEADRLRAFEGPFWITANGDRVHTVQGCHGQRNAFRPAKSYTLCNYCDREKPLFVVMPPNHT